MYIENLKSHVPFIGNGCGAWNGKLLEFVLANTQPAKNYFSKIWQEISDSERTFSEQLFCKIMEKNECLRTDV